MDAALAVGLVVAVATAIFTALKGKWVALAVGFFAPLVWVVSAIRLAKPGSRWARRYDERKLEAARRRHASGRYRAAAAAAMALPLVLGVGLLFAAQAYRIPSSSMQPTLLCGEEPPCRGETSDRVLAVKLTGGLGRGDIVAFAAPPQLVERCGIDGTFISRVVGLEGEAIAARGGRILVDGEPIAEPYAEMASEEPFEAEVPQGHVFVLGDNRPQSCDSRVWGPLPEENVVARAVFRYWPLDRLGRL